MGNCCGKQSTKSSPSNSFTNLKFTSPNDRKSSAKSSNGRTRKKSGDSLKEKGKTGKTLDVHPGKQAIPTGNRIPNGVYTAKPVQVQYESNHSNPAVPSGNGKLGQYKSNASPATDSDGRTPSYKLRQADLSKGSANNSPNNSRGGSSKQNSIERSAQSQLANDRAGSIRLEQHRKTSSVDLVKRGHVRTGSGTSNVVRDRSDSQKRIPADFIRKGSWAVNEPKVKRNDSDKKIDNSPQLPRNGVPAYQSSQPSILVDHNVNMADNLRSQNKALHVPHRSSSIQRPTSPSAMTRSDSCKNELNPVLRNKSHLHIQQRRQVVSAMTINTGTTNGSDGSSSGDSSRRQSGDFTSSIGNKKPLPADLDQQCACVIKWKKGNLLGRGTFGKVYSAVTDDGQIVAVKQIQLDTTNWEQAESDYKLIQREVHIQKTLNHPNIVKFLDCGLDVTDYTINILMEHVSGGTIASMLKKFGTFEEPVFRRYCSQLIDAITYLHSNNVVHRDIKGSNIMVTTTGFIKLIDFGTAKKTTDDLVTPLSAMKLDFCIKGTPYWMAPEVVQMTGEPTCKADIWSIGCTVIEMATGSPPYFHMQPMSALFVIGSTDKPSPKLPDEYSDAAKDFVSKCLTKYMAKRPTAAELGQHRFMLKEFIRQYQDNRRFYI